MSTSAAGKTEREIILQLELTQVYVTIRMDDTFTLNCRPRIPVGQTQTNTASRWAVAKATPFEPDSSICKLAVMRAQLVD